MSLKKYNHDSKKISLLLAKHNFENDKILLSFLKEKIIRILLVIRDNKLAPYYHAVDFALYLESSDKQINNWIRRSKLKTTNYESLCTNDKIYLIDNSPKKIDKKACFLTTLNIKHILQLTRKPKAIDICKKIDIELNVKNNYRESEVLNNISKFLSNLNTKYKLQYAVGKYKIDMYIPDKKIAIEIDEFGHSDRNQKYENEREIIIKKKLNCKLLRINPDDSNFCIYSEIANITKLLYE